MPETSVSRRPRQGEQTKAGHSTTFFPHVIHFQALLEIETRVLVALRPDTLLESQLSLSKRPTECCSDDHIRNSAVPEGCTRIRATRLVFGILHDVLQGVKGNVSMESINALDYIGSNDAQQKKIRSQTMSLVLSQDENVAICSKDVDRSSERSRAVRCRFVLL